MTTVALPGSVVVKRIVKPGRAQLRPRVRQTDRGLTARPAPIGAMKSPGAAATRTCVVARLTLPATSLRTPAALSVAKPASPAFQPDDVSVTDEPSAAGVAAV